MKTTRLYSLFCAFAALTLLLGACKKRNSNPDFSYTGTLHAGYLISFHSNVQTGLWSFGDGSQSTDPNPNHTYTTAATYTITLVPDNDPAKTITKTIVIEGAYDFTYSGTPAAGYTVNFTSNASASGNSFLWNFGDGTTSTDAAPAHIFAENKNYEVSLTLNNETDHTIKKTVSIFAGGMHLADLPGTRTWHHIYTDAYPWPPYHTSYTRSDLEMAITALSVSTIQVGSDTLDYNSALSSDSVIVFYKYDLYHNKNNILYYNHRSSAIDYYKYTHISAGAGDANDHFFTP